MDISFVSRGKRGDLFAFKREQLITKGGRLVEERKKRRERFFLWLAIFVVRESRKKLIFGLLPRAGRKEEKEKGKLISLLSLLRFERKNIFFMC